MLEDIGNVVMQSNNAEKAITCYSAALSLNPPNPARLLVKRSKARATIMLWEDALKDADGLFHLSYVTTLSFNHSGNRSEPQGSLGIRKKARCAACFGAL
jgi:hypothetical protein